jgi:hypothetical protein
LKSDVCSAKLAAEVNAPLKDLNNELFSAKPEIIVHALLRDLKSEDFSAKPEAKLNEAFKLLARPLV